MATTVSLKPNAVEISGSTSGTTTLQATAVAGTTTLTLPAATDTLVGKATTDTLTNKTLTGAAMNGTLGATTPSTASVTTLTTSSTITHNGGTAYGVAYLDGSKVLTTGSALVFDGTNLGVGVTPTGTSKFEVYTGTGAFNGVTARFNAANSPIAFGIANSNGFPYLGFNTIQVSATDNQTYATSNFASRLDASSGGFKFNIAASGTAGAGISFTQAMTLDASGNLLVGVTSGSTKMYVVDTSASVSTARFFKNVASSQAVGALTIDKFDNTSTTAQIFVQFTINNQGTGSGQINANGASAAAFGSFSDSRLKENITELPSQLSNIMALRPVEFDYIESEGGGHQIGFIAQEVKEIYPDLVGERADGMFTLTDMNKNDARLIKAIQEQQALITQLTARITALESA